MQLLSTEIGDDWIELNYADGPELSATSPFVLIRLHREVDHSKSVAWNRYWALADLQEIVRELRNADRDTVEKNA